MKKNSLLLVIVIAGALLRIVSLQGLPSGFTPDEASFGYDAYSLIQTGKDQWGTPWPLVFKSFGDYKMPLYTYLTIPSVYLFGLNETAVRLPNAIIGSMAIVATYLLANKTFNRKVAILAALLLAFSPWHIPLSRGAFEANLTAFLMPMGVCFFIIGTKNSKLMSLSAAFFGLNLFSYHSARLVTPFIVLALILSNLKEIRMDYKKYLFPFFVFSCFALVGLFTLMQGAAVRASTSTIFASAENVFNDRVHSIASGEPVLLAKVFNNKATYLVNKFSENYASYFSPEFLFINGAREGTYGMVPGMGVLFPFEIVGIVFLLIALVKSKLKLPLWLLIWILAAPVPAAISVGPGMAANRAAVLMPAIQIISALGLFYLLSIITKKYATYTKVVLGIIFIVSFTVFIENYIYGQPAGQARAMLYGSRELVDKISKIEDQYSEILISKDLSEPHIFVAFYNRMDPELYQLESIKWNFEEKNLAWVDQLPEYVLGKYTFKSVNWNDDIKIPSRLFASSSENVPDSINVIDVIEYPNGLAAYAIADNKTTEFAKAEK